MAGWLVRFGRKRCVWYYSSIYVEELRKITNILVLTDAPAKVTNRALSKYRYRACRCYILLEYLSHCFTKFGLKISCLLH
jgi:hypothetical protein